MRRVVATDTERDREGFTLVEIAIVAVIIGLLAMIAIPSFLKARQDSRVAAYANDLRLVMDAVEMYAMRYGDYPADASRGVKPSGMAAYLPRMNWAGSTPLGGNPHSSPF